MLRMLRKTTASVARSVGSVASGECVNVDDLSSWEFVDPSQSDDEDLYSFDDGEITSDGDDSVSEDPGPKSEEEENASDSRDSVNPDDIISMQSLSVSPPIHFPVDVIHNLAYCEDFEKEEEEDPEDDDDCDGVDGEDVDDELIPWKLKDKFGKQRIRKMGKRSGPKVNKSKRLPYYYNRPGCLYGKHGLGVQHSYI